MRISETSQGRDDGAIIKEGRVFRPLYKHLLDNMPKDLVVEMARRQIESITHAQSRNETPITDSKAAFAEQTP